MPERVFGVLPYVWISHSHAAAFFLPTWYSQVHKGSQPERHFCHAIEGRLQYAHGHHGAPCISASSGGGCWLRFHGVHRRRPSCEASTRSATQTETQPRMFPHRRVCRRSCRGAWKASSDSSPGATGRLLRGAAKSPWGETAQSTAHTHPFTRKRSI